MSKVSIGDKFGRLTVVSAPVAGKVACVCTCGTRRDYVTGNLRSGATKSCGCIRRERNNHTIHGGSGSLTHKRWQTMRRRCTEPGFIGYEHYGGRGIKVCDRWGDYEMFLADMGECPPGLTIDRIDPNGNYEPGNCRWATKLTQARNTRANHLLEFNGQTKCLEEWAEECGINSRSLMSRIRLGWSVEKALTTPVRAHKQYAPRG